MSYAQAQPIAVGEIPVIDLSGLGDGGPERAADRRGNAARGRGGRVLLHPGPRHPQALIDDVLRVSAAFFAQETERKQEVAVNAGHRGFIRMGEAVMTGGKRPDLKESFVWGLDAPGADGIPPNRWPAAMPEMRTGLTRFFEAGHGIGWGLLRAVATALDVPPDTFLRTIDRPISRGSIIYYPPQPPEMGSDQFGVSPHTDYGVLTLLYQDATGGLQVQGRDGAWLTAHPIPGSFVVNVGDLLARWSNDRFRSTPHRVVNRSGKSRYSTALFIDPNRDTLVAPLVRPGEVPRYEPVTCGDYLRSRLDATFAYRKAAAT